MQDSEMRRTRKRNLIEDLDLAPRVYQGLPHGPNQTRPEVMISGRVGGGVKEAHGSEKWRD
jgi:hypothetical protein